jgi:F0F1-type ATP synthase gamma subunit
MGKVTRIKGDMDDVDALLEILSVIKDVATNKFFAFAQRKANFQKFFEAFLELFAVMQHVDSTCPLLKNDRPEVTILTIASDQAFMSQANSRIASLAFQQYIKNPGATISCMGGRCAERIKMLGVKEFDRIFLPSDYPDRYLLALELRTYLVDRVMTGKSGKVIIIHLWAKTFSIIKPRLLTLLPASELVRTGGGELSEEGDAIGETTEPEDKIKLIMESDPDKMMKSLADIWIHSRLFEMLSDILLVESATQAQQLESALESLGSEKKGLLTSFRKAGREELNKAMREVFTSSSVSKGKR